MVVNGTLPAEKLLARQSPVGRRIVSIGAVFRRTGPRLQEGKELTGSPLQEMVLPSKVAIQRVTVEKPFFKRVSPGYFYESDLV